MRPVRKCAEERDTAQWTPVHDDTADEELESGRKRSLNERILFGCP